MSVTAVPIRPLSRGAVLKLWLGLLVLGLAAAGLAWVGTSSFQVVALDSGVRYRILREGTGPTITPADLFALRYQLRVNEVDGTRHRIATRASSRWPAAPFPGLCEALQSCVRETVPALVCRPASGPGPLRPAAVHSASDTLVFEVEVLQIAPGMAAMQQNDGPPALRLRGRLRARRPPARHRPSVRTRAASLSPRLHQATPTAKLTIGHASAEAGAVRRRTASAWSSSTSDRAPP